MPLNNYFIGFIAIVTLIRMALILTGPLDAKEKVTKASYWIVGLVLVVISWLVLGKIFGVSTDGFGTANPNTGTGTTGTTMDDQNSSNPGTYYDPNYNEQTTSGEIIVNPND